MQTSLLQNIKSKIMVNSDLDSFISFVIRCADFRAPLYLAAQLLRLDLREVGEEALRLLISSCLSIKFLYICSGLSILHYRIPFVRNLVSCAIVSMTSEEQKASPCIDNIYLLESFGLHHTGHVPSNLRMQALIQRASALLSLTTALTTVSETPLLQSVDSWERLRNTLLRLPPGYFDNQRAMDPTYDPFSYLATHTVYIAAISSSSKTSPSFATLLLSSLSLSDFTHKVSMLTSQEDRRQLLLQALGDIHSCSDVDFSPDMWESIRNCSLYSQTLQKLLETGWVSSFVDTFTKLYSECATKCLSDIRRTAEACGDVFKHAANYSIQEQLLSFINLNENVCILQRRVFLRFFIMTASPSKVDAAIIRLLKADNAVETSINIPNTSFSRKLLKNLALTFTYAALLEFLE
ncbi:Hypothetical protein GLP15_4905 [Giardia lamblia P15]|uniref:Uncharacterized protein n=1 Tax=Giardia intestinalis (strain P15) TaxID=658858 RepID=E1F9S8_GIAIA|nr:Hypothetical protein GLP15_4905 [Giardia lamblia P15]